GGPPAAIVSSAIASISTEAVPIDLPTVLSLAGEKPNAIRLARERLAEADAQVDASTAGLLPSIAVGGNFARHTGIIQDVGGKFFDTTRQRVFLGATGELVFDVGGGVFAYLRDRQRLAA